MGNIEKSYLTDFIKYQQSLSKKFIDNFPETTNSNWLLDAPKNGEIDCCGEKWNFLKHGIGISFSRVIPIPNVIIDVHNHFGESLLIDEWRFSQFLESIGCEKTKEEIIDFFHQMESFGIIKKYSENNYLFI